VPDAYVPATFPVSACVYLERDGKILLLKRAGGEATGAWYVPGGGVEHGESFEEAARRELFEEAGLAPDGSLTVVSVGMFHVYGRDAVRIAYACDCATGEPRISDEHSAARWIDPYEYRERYFNDAVVANVEAQDVHFAQLIKAVRDELDDYLRWRDMRDAARKHG
jgi:ADP-ribose pyrophosphatase YjhB (NUDIX family)